MTLSNRYIVVVAVWAAQTMQAAPAAEPSDSVVNHVETQTVVVSSDAKTIGTLSGQPVSFTQMDERNIQRLGTTSLKQVSAYIPNLFIPDYGSRLTSAIYVRGIGSRANTPSVGLYVDEVAQTEKSAFDADFSDVVRVDVLRGPQSTLYGRNAMGGIIKLYTFNPLDTRRTGTMNCLRIGYSTRETGRYAHWRTAHAAGSDAAWAFSAFYRGSDGYNRNVFLKRRSNGGESGGGRFRYVYNPVHHPRLSVDYQTSLEYSDENGYDYADMATGRIQENHMGTYRRTLLNNSLRIESVAPRFTWSSVTSYQFLTDRMFMDQDFSPADVFTLSQRQRSHVLSEELVAKSHEGNHIEWLGGIFVSHQWLHTDAPVHFASDGIQSFIQSGMDKGLEKANAAMNPKGMGLAMKLVDTTLPVEGLFDTPVFNAAAFAQVAFKNLLARGLDLTTGLRLDYEHGKMDYNSGATTHFNFQMKRGPVTMIDRSYTTDSYYRGTLRRNDTKLLPRVALSYRLPGRPDDLVYVSVSKGFRAGGYNVQMFSDLVQSRLRNDMMSTLSADPQVGPAMNRYMTVGTSPSADSTTVYKPETSWNYEVGTHLNFLDRHLSLSASLFYIHVNNQQVTRFAPNGLGRQMANVGESESWGGELALSGWFPLFRRPLTLTASYGYTHAQFVDYDGGMNGVESQVYNGNAVPFAPRHTLSASAEYVIPVSRAYLNLGVNVQALGRIYWTEDNTLSQPFYALLGAHARIDMEGWSINVWGKNLTDTRYHSFAFASLGNNYAQTARPLQFGVDVTLKF